LWWPFLFQKPYLLTNAPVLSFCASVSATESAIVLINAGANIDYSNNASFVL
jgi:hypothetical protein